MSLPALEDITSHRLTEAGCVEPIEGLTRIETTSKERPHWQRFWEDQGIDRLGVELIQNLDGPADPRLETALAADGWEIDGSAVRFAITNGSNISGVRLVKGHHVRLR